VADLLGARVRAIVDRALDRVFAEPFDVRTAQEFEELVATSPIGQAPGPTATSVTAFVAAATPIARRALATASKSGKVAGKLPLPSARAVKVGLASIPIAMRLSTTTRRGVRELQLLASFLISRLRDSRIEPDPRFVRALTLSLYLDSARRPVLDIPSGRAAGGIARQWVLRSLGGDVDSAVRARARRQAEAIDRLDLPGLATEWARHHPRPPELTAGE